MGRLRARGLVQPLTVHPSSSGTLPLMLLLPSHGADYSAAPCCCHTLSLEYSKSFFPSCSLSLWKYWEDPFYSEMSLSPFVDEQKSLLQRGEPVFPLMRIHTSPGNVALLPSAPGSLSPLSTMEELTPPLSEHTPCLSFL